MKKRKNVILSAITCFVSICMLMLGVYAASNPSVSINGQVSYTARDAKVLVQGKVNGAKDATTGAQMATVDYPATTTLTSNDVTATKVTNSQMQYLDYTAGTGNSEQDVLSPWNIGTLEFAEDNTGVKDITISFKLTNLSTYPVQATLTFPTGATASDLANAKVSRTASATSAYLAQNGGSEEISVTYKLTNDSQNIPDDATNLLGMNIAFAKAAPQKANSVSVINANGGKVTMGKQSSSSTAEDVQWKCFAYSTDGNTWTKLDSGASIPTTAKYGYFVLDNVKVSEYSELVNVEFLREDHYNKNYFHTENALYSSNVYANDYYYSDVRQTLKGLESTLSINTNSEIYKAIQGRTISDLYNAIKSDGTQLDLPVYANGSDVDTFWLLSYAEASEYFSDDASREWMNGSTSVGYWLRSPYTGNEFHDSCYIIGGDEYTYDESSGGHVMIGGGEIKYDEIGDGYDIDNRYGARAAFKLELE